MTLKFRITYLDDPIMHGTIAGLVGGIALTFYGLFMKFLHLTDRIFIDYGEIIILGHQSGYFPVVGVIAHLIHTSLWGVIFSFIMKFGRKKYYVLKGIGLGMVIWLFSLGIATMYKILLFDVIESKVALVLLSGASFYGLIMSLVYRYLDQKLLSYTSYLESK